MEIQSAKIILSQPANPEYLKDWFDEEQNMITAFYILSVDYEPLIYNIKSDQKTKFFHKKRKRSSGIAANWDCASIIIATQNRFNPNHIHNYFLLATDVIYWYNQDQQIHNLALGGIVEQLNPLMKMLVEKHQHYKTINFNELETVIATSNDQATIKAYRKLAKWFSPQVINQQNQIGHLLDHQEQAQRISKNIVLKKLIAFYYAKQDQIQGGI